MSCLCSSVNPRLNTVFVIKNEANLSRHGRHLIQMAQLKDDNVLMQNTQNFVCVVHQNDVFVFEIRHDHSGHFSERNTLSMLRWEYYWQSMASDV